MNRLEFLVGVAATAGATASPAPNPWEMWDKSPALPYDRPIEISIELLDAGKTQFKLTQYRGAPVIVNIFATWCEPCNTEQPLLVAAASRYASSGLQFIGIDAGDSDDAVRSYRKKYGITYPIAMDRTWAFTDSLEVGDSGADSVVPTSLFFRPDGYLYGVLRDCMEADEVKYRIEKFLRDLENVPNGNTGKSRARVLRGL